jgi:ribose 5-phosphate isomerase B
MPRDTIAIAADHAGFALKEALKSELTALDHAVLDLGTGNGADSVDYPDFADRLAAAMAAGKAARGVLVCGTGIGIAMAANRHAHVRAAVCHDETSARLSRQHNDANVLALGARLIGPETARCALRVFLATDFEGGRHRRRVDKLTPAFATQDAN